MTYLRPPVDRSDMLTTAAAMARVCRDVADDWFDRDADVWCRWTDAAERYEAMKPDTIIPLF